MSRLVAMVCNDPDRLRCALHPVQQALWAAPELADGSRGFDAWGIGLYQGGEVLLKRRPQHSVAPVDFFAIAADLRTDTFIAHARTATVGDNRNENTHPFRFRSWLFAHHGTLPGFGGDDPARPSSEQAALTETLLAEIPDFLRRSLRGQTDSELLFHLFLTRLHETNHLDIAEVRLADAQAALQRTLVKLERVLAQRAPRAGRNFGALVLANGRYLMAAGRGTAIHASRVDGISDCEVCRGNNVASHKLVSHDHLRAVLLLADVPALSGAAAALFRTVPDDTLLTIARDLTVTELPLGQV